MVSITKHLKISFLTVFLYAFSTVFYYPPVFFVTYAVMVLHECAHMTAAACIGLRVDYIALMPFGANLRLKNKMVYSLADEIILYLSGPLVNALAAAASAFIYARTGKDILRLFYMTNLTLFAVNLLPALPLDGGMIMRRILTDCIGFKRAYKVCAAISAAVFILIAALGVYAVVTVRNISILMFSSLILGNIFTRREMYSADFARDVIRRRNNITVS